MAYRLWGFGANHAGQLGISVAESHDSTPVPFLVQLPKDSRPKKVACGKAFSILLSGNSPNVLLCGMQDTARDGTKQPMFECLPLPTGLESADAILDVIVGEVYAAIVSNRGELFSCGKLESSHDFSIEDKDRFFSVKPVELPFPQRIICVSVGSGHVLASSASGICFSWGNNEKGQLGIGSNAHFIQQPQEIKSLNGIPVKQVVTGGQHSFVLTVSGALFAFGDNSAGQLGLGDETNREYPCLVKFLRSQFIMYMAAGYAHSVALTADGGVFTFGSGRFGQLGHNSMGNENIPRKIIELMGSYVQQIACGRNHTMALVRGTPLPRLYAFGHGTFGQLGASQESYANSSMPILSKAVMDAIGKCVPKQRIRSIFAGGDTCFVITDNVDNSNSIPDFTSDSALVQIPHLEVSLIKDLLDGDQNHLEEALNCIFRSASCLNASFLLSGRKHFKCSSSNSGVSIADARRGWHALLTCHRLCHSLKNKNESQSVADFILGLVSESLLPSLLKNPPDVEALRLYLILPSSARFDNPDHFITLQCPFAAAVIGLERPAEKVLQRWWAAVSRDDFARLVLAYKKCCMHITGILSSSKCSQLLNPIAAHQSGIDFDVESRNNLKRLQVSLEILKRFWTINEDMRHGDDRLDCDQFYMPEIRDHTNVREAYIAWWHTKRTPQHESLFNLCNYPFIFDALAKSILLQTDAQLQMHYAMESARNRAIVNIFLPFAEPEVPFLMVQVNRNNIVHDTIQQLGGVGRSTDYKKPLKVTFIGEEGDDAGGVKKEFFLLLFREVFDPKYGMFRSDELSRLNWFNDILEDDESINMYHFIGLLCGLAIYNSIIVDMSFPTALFKKLLKRPCTLEDLKEFSPTVGRSLESLLEFDGPGSLEDVFALTFEISKTRFDATETIELVPGGHSKSVTAENRTEYCEAYVDYVFNKSVQRQFNAFMGGFEMVCGGNVFSLFHPSELQAMVIGNENYDWIAFEKNAEYKGEYDARHPTIRIFWEVFHELSLPDKKRFLTFLTGSDRIPILGMQAVKIIIQPIKVKETFLPVAHTCFNVLDLPVYKDKETLKAKLVLAIQHSQGFGIA